MLEDSKMTTANLTAERLRELLDYDAETGVFRWRVTRTRAKAGNVAGSRRNGYIVIGCDGTSYFAHRLAWLYVYGRWPAPLIDHINGVRSDNRLANLRECSHTKNMWNMRLSRANTSGVKGVTWNRLVGAWQALVIANGREHYGFFEDVQSAEAAVRRCRERVHGEFANHGHGSALIQPPNCFYPEV